MSIADKSVTLRHLRYFVAAALEGSLAGAARRLHVAQPALSRQIQELESLCATPVFVRQRRGVRLTAAGAELLAGGREALDGLRDALRRARLASQGRLGRVRIGLGRAMLHAPGLGRAIALVREWYPDVELVVLEAATLRQPGMLLAGELDIAIGLHGSAEDPAIAATVLYDESLDCVALAASHPLASRDAIDIEELRDLPLISFDQRAAPSMPELFRAFTAAGIDQWEGHESVDSVITHVAAGRGWAPMPGALLGYAPDGTVVRPLRGLRVPVNVAARRRADDSSPLVTNVMKAIAAAVREERDPEQRGPPGASGADAPDADVWTEIPPVLELRHLRALQVVAEERSTRAAARRLQLTQSGLSRQLTALERATGARLLERQGARLALTNAGLAFRDLSVAALARIDSAMRSACREHETANSCRIGAVPTEIAGPLLLDVLRQLRDRTPQLVPEVRELLTSMQVPALRAGEIDIGVSGAFPFAGDDPTIAATELGADVIDCVLLARTHPLAAREILEPGDLRDVPFVFVSREIFPPMYDAVMEAFARIGIVPAPHDPVEGVRAIWRIVADTVGWTITISSLRNRPPEGLVALPVRGLHIRWPRHLLWRREEQDPEILAIIEAFRTRVSPTHDQSATFS